MRLLQAQRNRRNRGMARRGGQGAVGAPAVSDNLPLSTEEKKRENSSLNLLTCVNHKNHPFIHESFCGHRGRQAPLCSPALWNTIPGRGGKESNPKHCHFMGARNPSGSLFYSDWWQRPFATNLLETFIFSSQLELFKCRELPLPKSMSDTRWMGQAQLCSLGRFSSHCDPARLPAIHMCYFPFVVMACGTWPENIINFRSGLTNNKPTVSREEVLGRPAVGLSRAVGTQCMQVWGGKMIIHRKEMH